MTETPHTLASVLPASQPRTRWPLFAAGAVLLLVLAGVGLVLLFSRDEPPAPTVGTLTIRGTVTVPLTGELRPIDTQCDGSGGYSDMRAGAAVAVTDPASKTIALGNLGPGRVDGSTGHQLCEFAFEVAGVPSGAGFYGVEVGHRGRIQYAEADLSRPMKLSLGE